MNQTSSIEEQDPPKQEPKHELEALPVFLKKLEETSSHEDKVSMAITYMRQALSQNGLPNFKGFWEVRKLCLPLFKDLPVGPTRTHFWEEYIELTREGRRLKNLLDEETAFAVEQIEIAIKALEDEIQGFHTHRDDILEKTPDVDFPVQTKTLEKHFSKYQQAQKQLNLLNAYASRINALRKELIKTEMRIRQKNKFFERLSSLGDLVFPARKDLIKEISDLFVGDVTFFVDGNFSPQTFNYDKIRRSVFFFREEIKNLQSIAKILTLNTHAFTVTREQLSHCWDQLKGMEKELKKEFSVQRQKSSENVELVKAKILEISTQLKEESLSTEEASKQLDDVSRWMRDLELTHHDVKALKEELRVARQPIEDLKEKAEQARKQKDLEFEQKRQKQVEDFKLKLESLKENVHLPSAEELLVECKKELSSLPLTKGEKHLIERSLKTIREQIEERKEQTLLELPDDVKAALQNLADILDQRKKRRQEIKTQIEDYRKIIGGSNLDFEKAIEFNELMAIEKERLEKIDDGIREIELKIKELKKKS